MKLLDTHQHLIYRRHLSYAWVDNVPELSGKDFTLESYRQLTAGKNVAGTLFMEVDADDYQAEARFVAELAADPKNRILGLIASCRPETAAGFDGWLEECGALQVVGFRRILHEQPDELSLSSLFRENLRKIGAQGKSFDMVFRADQLDIARDLAKSCGDMALVLDHCGVPDVAKGDRDQWRAGITAIAQLPHVACKLSGILAYCARDAATLAAIRPYIDHVLESFGPERLVWGSDWPVVNKRASLPQWIDMFQTIMADVSDAEAAAICHGNAERIYRVSL